MKEGLRTSELSLFFGFVMKYLDIEKFHIISRFMFKHGKNSFIGFFVGSCRAFFCRSSFERDSLLEGSFL